MLKEVTTYHLEMLNPAELRGKHAPTGDFQVRRAEIPCPELNRFLYASVGGDWYWTDRLSWSYSKWLDYLNRPELETWVGYRSGTPAGYFELETQAGGSVEIAYFGLLPSFIGKQLGGALLTAAVERAWASGAARVWVHTCTLDGPHALKNYLARGFRQFEEEKEWKTLPECPPGSLARSTGLGGY
ncbi:MAG: GNAT family N-acetyltransferase [Terriglobia bacterium]